MADHLIKKKNEENWYVRLKVPSDVVSKIGRSVFIRSLKTTSHREALHASHAYLAAWRAQIAAARGQRTLPSDWQENAIRLTLALDEMNKQKKRAAIGEPYTGPKRDVERLEAFMLADPDFLKGVQAILPPTTGNELQDKLNAYNVVTEFLKDVLHDVYTEGFNINDEQSRELVEIIASPTTHRHEPAITEARLEAFQKHRKAQHIDQKTIDQQESKLRKLAAFLKQSQNHLSSESVGEWLNGLELASKTLTQYLLAGSMFWKWAIRYDAPWRSEFKDRANPFENHDLPKVRGKARADARRKDYTIAELAKLLEAARHRNLNPLADLITLASLTGARIEELCKLRVENLLTAEGVEFFDITDSKTAAGIRRVPIHPSLKATVKRLATDTKDGYLIPSSSRNKYGKRSDALSKAFGRLKTDLGFGTSHVFHSIRITVITQLLRQDVPGPIIAQLVGHETGLVTFDIYSKGASPVQMLAAISKLPSILGAKL
ncbi:tyrosine-type recombinase/integrase [Pseudomonas sp. Sample_24]|uniref:tyrosine-type recombinase/integrase n=1 Tax=Pseudomonas sp. Sample_24 TaxID=2448268 RepID=UPI00103290F5|nr:tyrosine-type recombinase/integrase [Pseudomonas sp. Sample_24]